MSTTTSRLINQSIANIVERLRLMKDRQHLLKHSVVSVASLRHTNEEIAFLEELLINLKKMRALND